jgi:large subunit ribosomal protein L19
VKLSLKVVEGEKTRTQAFEGIVIRRRGTGVSASFTVLKRTKGSTDTVEKVFPLHSPTIESLKVVKSTKVRRSKLYYLRSKSA